MALRILDLFSGIGGFSLAARWIGGFEMVQFVERDPFCQRILRKHWPDVPIHDDICTYDPEPRSADVVVGGFPCQDISQAGKGAGLSGERSGLFYELLRIVRVVEPRYVVLENVAAILGRGLDDVLGALAEAGYDTEWACIPASAVGACHQRDRWWCVAYSQGGRWGARPGQGQGQAGHEGSGTGDGGEGFTADAIRLRRQRRRAPINLAGQAGAGQVDGQQWQRYGDATDDCGAATHPHRQRLERTNQLGGSTTTWPAATARLDPNWRGYVSEPVLRRGDDGLRNRVDRLKALGNAVVPQVAAIPLARVRELHDGRKSDHCMT